MIKLTDEQMDTCYRLYWDTGRSFGDAINYSLELINKSKTHRVVEAPEGFEFDNSIGDLKAKHIEYPFIQVAIKPIPKPCPPPVLEPVTVTVEDIYPMLPTPPKEYQVQFGLPKILANQGFTHGFPESSTIMQEISLLSQNEPRICLRKWEGK